MTRWATSDMSLLSAARIASARRKLERLLTHTYSRTRMVSGIEDDEANTPQVPDGAPTVGVACTYGTVNRVLRDEGGTTIVAVPTLMVSATDPIAVGDRVTAVTDSLGVVIAAGPLRVERLLDDTAGLGAALLPTWELRGARAVS